MEKILHVIDAINDWMGRIAGWLLVPLSFLVLFDVILRYVLNMPTIWVWDVGVQIQAAIVVLGGGYALLHKGHVSVDIFISKLSTRKRALLDAIMCIFLVGDIYLGPNCLSSESTYRNWRWRATTTGNCQLDT